MVPKGTPGPSIFVPVCPQIKYFCRLRRPSTQKTEKGVDKTAASHYIG
jgi:hypothetical protein